MAFQGGFGFELDRIPHHNGLVMGPSGELLIRGRMDTHGIH
jgi:hypothetical protein